MSKLSDLLAKADAAMLPKPKPQKQELNTKPKVHPVKERNKQLFAQTPGARMASSIIKIQERKRQEVKEQRAKEEQEVAELQAYREERQDYLRLHRRFQVGNLTQAMLARYQELRPRHEGAEKQ